MTVSYGCKCGFCELERKIHKKLQEKIYKFYTGDTYLKSTHRPLEK